MRIHGYVRAEISAGDNVYATQLGEIDRKTYGWMTRAAVRFSTATETELGTLRTYIDSRFQYANGEDSTSTGTIRNAWIELGGLRVGMADTAFSSWTDGYGTIYSDDMLTYSGKRTNFISYTFNGGNGFSGIISIEQGNKDSDIVAARSNYRPDFVLGGAPISTLTSGSNLIPDYAPHIVGGLKYSQGWGGVSTVVAYDTVYDEWAAKLRLDINATDQLSLFLMAGYKSGDDHTYIDPSYGSNGYHAGRNDWGVYRVNNTPYGDWSGDWIVWAGGQYRFNDDRTSFNLQLSYDDWENFAVGVNVEHEIVPNLIITAELDYIDWGNGYGYASFTDGAGLAHMGVRSSLSDESAFRGIIRLQRDF